MTYLNVLRQLDFNKINNSNKIMNLMTCQHKLKFDILFLYYKIILIIVF